MIIDAEQMVVGYAFIARRYGRVGLCDPVAVQQACAQAAQLAGPDPRREPGALFFSLASRRRAFPFAWKLMARHAARSQARVNGFTLDTDDDTLDAWCLDVLHQRADADEIVARVLVRLLPLNAP